MYKAFQITNINDKWNEPQKDLFPWGRLQKSVDEFAIGEILRKLLKPDGVVDGELMQRAWFPQVEAEVFISHSHQDETKALNFAGYLDKHFGLTSFVDSAVWRYADDLLRAIDNKYCQNDDETMYLYEKRNG